MKKRALPQNDSRFSRRFAIAGGLFFLFALLKFVGFRIPRKPVIIPVRDLIPQSTGVFLTKDFALFDRNGKYWALSRTCTHLGCRLNYIADKDILECPCHNSQFDAATGLVLKGPAKKALTAFAVTRRNSEPYYMVNM